jgi:cysteine desulfurase/selenocysteine lyase
MKSAVMAPPAGLDNFDVRRLRQDFPILSTQVHGKPLVFLDSAASSQKPEAVIEAIARYYRSSHANIHRAVYTLSQRATQAHDEARLKARDFLGARSEREIIFTRGATEGINLVAATYGRKHIGADDEILISGMEHHANIVPWQMLCQQTGARLKVIPVTDSGELDLDVLPALLNKRVKMLALVHVSNTLGTVNPVETIIGMARPLGIPVLIDGAQAVPHQAVNVQALDCDFYVFSGHKVFGPTGIGVLYGKEKLLEDMPPYQGGGDMIRSVTFERTLYNDLPYKFEAGTPDIAGAIGLGAAIDYVQAIGMDRIGAYEHILLEYATEALSSIKGLRIIGTAPKKAAVVSFDLEGVHPHDIGQLLDFEGVAVRTGHHCTQPLMDRFGVPATTRASFAFYNTIEEIDRLVAALEKVRKVFNL